MTTLHILLLVLVGILILVLLMALNFHAKKDFKSIKEGDTLYIPGEYNCFGDPNWFKKPCKLRVASKTKEEITVEYDDGIEYGYNLWDFIRDRIVTEERYNKLLKVEK